MVTNKKLRSLLTKGPNYREKENINWKRVLICITDGILKCKLNWTSIEHQFSSVLNQWSSLLISLVKKKISSIKKIRKNKSFWNPYSKKILNQCDIKAALNNLHQNFVLTPTDKAAHNVAIICKSFYVKTLIKEVTTGPTYEMVQKNLCEILTAHDKMVKRFGFKLEKVQKQLPYLRWNPKMHKNPSKQRFIASSACCTTKKVSQTISSCLKLIQKTNQSYCKKIQSYTGLNYMWIVKNSQEIFGKLKGKIRNLKTFDFSTLYTAIPHNKLIKELSELIQSTFKGAKSKYIKPFKKSARWGKKVLGKGLHISCDNLISMIKWLVNNTYITVGDKIFRQKIGIPMGTDCAPYLANLYLYNYELRFMKNQLKAKNYDLLYKFNRSCRYIDDLLLINNDNKMDKYKKLIYPPELILTSEDKSDQTVNYLDLTLSINHSLLDYKIFDKRDHFNFPIVNFPNLSGNIPKSHSYGVFTSQLVRFARGCKKLDDFKLRTKTLVLRLLKQNFTRPKLIKTFRNFIFRHHSLLQKYGKLIVLNLDKLILSLFYDHIT